MKKTKKIDFVQEKEHILLEFKMKHKKIIQSKFFFIDMLGHSILSTKTK